MSRKSARKPKRMRMPPRRAPKDRELAPLVYLRRAPEPEKKFTRIWP